MRQPVTLEFEAELLAFVEALRQCLVAIVDSNDAIRLAFLAALDTRKIAQEIRNALASISAPVTVTAPAEIVELSESLKRREPRVIH